MGADEEGTHERLKGHLRELIEPKLAEHRGRVVKNTGDGFLAEFASVVDAVRCAVEVQRGMVERNRATAPEKRIEFRVGINLGDVIVEALDIFGDGVNAPLTPSERAHWAIITLDPDSVVNDPDRRDNKTRTDRQDFIPWSPFPPIKGVNPLND
jgi:hypothetical protein